MVSHGSSNDLTLSARLWPVPCWVDRSDQDRPAQRRFASRVHPRDIPMHRSPRCVAHEWASASGEGRRAKRRASFPHSTGVAAFPRPARAHRPRQAAGAAPKGQLLGVQGCHIIDAVTFALRFCGAFGYPLCAQMLLGRRETVRGALLTEPATSARVAYLSLRTVDCDLGNGAGRDEFVAGPERARHDEAVHGLPVREDHRQPAAGTGG